jgi:hypothetical protein
MGNGLLDSSGTSQFELEKYGKIRDIVVAWYQRNYLEHEIEDFDFDLSEREGRLKLVLLGVFFNCIFQEIKAFRLFGEMEKAGYLEFQELASFEGNLKKTMRKLEAETGNSWKILKVQAMVDSVKSLQIIFSQEGDIEGIIKAKGINYTINYLYERLSGVKAKLLWICRECKDRYNIPDAYCYIPDSHVNKFLVNIGFLDRYRIFSLEECLHISKRMSVFLGNQYFDLPYMRYHQEMCKQCESGNMQKCQINCRLSREK